MTNTRLASAALLAVFLLTTSQPAEARRSSSSGRQYVERCYGSNCYSPLSSHEGDPLAARYNRSARIGSSRSHRSRY